MKSNPPQDLARTSASSYRIARSPRLPRPPIANGSATRRGDLLRVTKPRPCTGYFGLSRNRRRLRVPYHLRGATRPSAVSYSTGVIFLCSPYSCHRTACYTFPFRAPRAIHTSRNIVFVRLQTSYHCALLVFIVARVASKNSFAFNAGYSNARECARRGIHAIATRLITGASDVSCT